MQQNGFKNVVGVDIVPEAIEICKKNEQVINHNVCCNKDWQNDTKFNFEMFEKKLVNVDEMHNTLKLGFGKTNELQI